MYELRTKRTKEERDLGFCFVFHAVLVVRVYMYVLLLRNIVALFVLQIGRAHV